MSKAKETKLSFDGVGKRDRKVVVTLARFKWKQAHNAPTEEMIRMVRFVWMRDMLWAARYRLHAGTLGRCMSAGLLVCDGAHLIATVAGIKLLDHDRRANAS